MPTKPTTKLAKQTRKLTDHYRLRIANIVRELGCALQHLDQADEDASRDADPDPELIEFRDCIEFAADLARETTEHIYDLHM